MKGRFPEGTSPSGSHSSDGNFLRILRFLLSLDYYVF